jgi:hypothetical protein
VQEVIVERSGKKVYEPKSPPFESISVDIVNKDGAVDLKK